MHELTQDCLIGYMLVEGEGRCRFFPGLTTIRRGGHLEETTVIGGDNRARRAAVRIRGLSPDYPTLRAGGRNRGDGSERADNGRRSLRPWVRGVLLRNFKCYGYLDRRYAHRYCNAHCYVYVQSYSYDLPPFVEPHPPPRLHSGRLDRRVGILQPEPECVVVRVAEVGVGLSLEGGDLARYFGEVSGYVLDGVGVVLGPRVWVLAHPLRIRQGRQIP